MEETVNESLSILLEKLFGDKELAEKFSACKTLDEFYDFCTGIQKGYTKEDLKDMLDMLGSGNMEYFEEGDGKITDEDLDMVAGGVNLSGKVAAGVLGVLSLASPISSNYASAYDQNQRSAVSVGKSVSVNSQGWRRFITSSTLKRLAVFVGATLVVGTAVYFARRALRANIGIGAGDGRGLSNMGNSCYINATLQQLYSISEFRLKVMNYKPSSSKDPTDMKIEALKTIFKSLDEEKPLERDVLYNAVQTLGYRGSQESADDFMMSDDRIGDVLERLDFNIGVNHLFPEDYNSVQEYFNKNANFPNKSVLSRNQIIVPLSQRVSDITESQVRKKVAEESGEATLSKKELEKRVKAKLKLQESTQTVKTFDVSKEITTLNGGKKYLTGVIIKEGPRRSGHYYSYKKMWDGQWYCFNDSSVTAVNYPDIENDIRENGSVLVYSS